MPSLMFRCPHCGLDYEYNGMSTFKDLEYCWQCNNELLPVLSRDIKRVAGVTMPFIKGRKRRELAERCKREANRRNS